MENRAEKVIRAIKLNSAGSIDASINQVLKEYSDTDYNFSREEIDKVLLDTCQEYINHFCDKPEAEIARYFYPDHFVHNEYERMINFLMNIQVREIDFITGEDYYINGFNREVWE